MKYLERRMNDCEERGREKETRSVGGQEKGEESGYNKEKKKQVLLIQGSFFRTRTMGPGPSYAYIHVHTLREYVSTSQLMYNDLLPCRECTSTVSSSSGRFLAVQRRTAYTYLSTYYVHCQVGR